MPQELAPRDKVKLQMTVVDEDAMATPATGDTATGDTATPTAVTDERSVMDQGEAVDIVQPDVNQTRVDKDATGMNELPAPDDVDFSGVDEYAGVVSNTVQMLKKVNPFGKPSESRKTLKTFIKDKEAGDKTVLEDARLKQAGRPDTLTPDELDDQLERMVSLTEKNKYVMYDKEGKPNFHPRNDLAAGNIYDLKHIKNGDDVDAAIQAMSVMLESTIQAARRGGDDGVLHDDAVRELARVLVMDPKRMREVLTRPNGTAAVTEEIYAMSMLYVQHATKLSGALEIAKKPNATQEDKERYFDLYKTQELLLSKFKAYKAEGGRGLRTFAMVKGEMDDATMTDYDWVSLALNRYDMDTVLALQTTGGDAAAITNSIYGMKALATLQKSSVEWFTKSILSGFKTQAINTIGVSSELGITIVDRYIAELGTKAMIASGRKYKEGWVAEGETAALLQGEMASYKMALNTALKIMLTSPSKEPKMYDGGKFIESETMFQHKDPVLNGILRSMDALNGGFMTSRVMGGVDGFAKVISEQGQFIALAHRKAYADTRRLSEEGLNPVKANHFYQSRFEDYLLNPTKEMVDEAQHFGKRVTYQDQTKAGTKVKELLRQVPILSFFTPFINTPISSFIKNFMERIPGVGYLPASMGAHINYGRGMNANELQMATARQVTGGAIIGAMYYLAEDGQLEGSRPDWKTTSGRREYDVWVAQKREEMAYLTDSEWQLQIKRIEQIAYIAQVVADMKTLSEQKDYEATERSLTQSERLEALASAVTKSLLQNMEDKTFLQGLSVFFEGIDKGFGRSMMSIGEGMMPASGLRRNLTDNFFLDTIKDKTTFQEKIGANLLWLRSELPDKLDMFARPRKSDWYISPIKSGQLDAGVKAIDTDTTKKQKLILDFLYQMSQSIHKVPFGVPERIYKGYKLSGKEYHDYVTFARSTAVDKRGRTFTDVIYEVITSDDFAKSAIEDAADEYGTENVGGKGQYNALQGLVRSWDRAALLIYAGKADDKSISVIDPKGVVPNLELLVNINKADDVKRVIKTGIDVNKPKD